MQIAFAIMLRIFHPFRVHRQRRRRRKAKQKKYRVNRTNTFETPRHENYAQSMQQCFIMQYRALSNGSLGPRQKLRSTIFADSVHVCVCAVVGCFFGEFLDNTNFIFFRQLQSCIEICCCRTSLSVKKKYLKNFHSRM